MEYKNGSLWSSASGETALLQQLTGELFCLLKLLDAGGFDLVMDPAQVGKWQYSVEEIPERLAGLQHVPGIVTHITGISPIGSTFSTSDPAKEARATKAAEESKVIEDVKKKVKRGRI